MAKHWNLLLAKDTSPLLYECGASFESKRTPKMETTTDFPLLSQEQGRPPLQQQPAQDTQMRKNISNTSFYGDQENSLLLFQDELQLESVEKELGGNDQSFKELLDFLSDCDENIYKFLLGDCHQEEEEEFLFF